MSKRKKKRSEREQKAENAAFRIAFGKPEDFHAWDVGTYETFMVPTGLNLTEVMIHEDTLEIYKAHTRKVPPEGEDDE